MNIKLEENVNKDLLNECPTCGDVDEDGYCAKHGLPVMDWKDSDEEEKIQKRRHKKKSRYLMVVIFFVDAWFILNTK